LFKFLLEKIITEKNVIGGNYESVQNVQFHEFSKAREESFLAGKNVVIS